MSWTSTVKGAALIVTIVAAFAGCMATVGYRRAGWDTSQCYWAWADDPHGGYEQMYCWRPGYASYQPFMHGGEYVRRYPPTYSGPRVVVVPPRVRIVHPGYIQPGMGVYIQPGRTPPPAYVPPRHGGPPVFVPRR